MAKAKTAKEEINEFLRSGAHGIVAESSAGSLNRAAELMFTAHGMTCPVIVVSRSGDTFLIRRDSLPQ